MTKEEFINKIRIALNNDEYRLLYYDNILTDIGFVHTAVFSSIEGEVYRFLSSSHDTIKAVYLDDDGSREDYILYFNEDGSLDTDALYKQVDVF